MRRLLASLLSLALAFGPLAPARAQEIVVPAAGAANANYATEAAGVTATFTGTVVTASATPLSYGTCVQLSAGIANDWAGLQVIIGSVSGSTSRYMLKIATDSGCSSVIVPDLYFEGASATPPAVTKLPLNVSAATPLYAALKSNSVSVTAQVRLRGFVRNAASAPMFNTMSAVAVDSANVRANTANISTVLTGSTTFDTLATLGNDYGALLIVPGTGSSAPTTSQATELAVATGAAASEVVVDRLEDWIINSGGTFSRGPGLLMERPFTNGQRISGQFLVNTNGDAVRAGVYGFR